MQFITLALTALATATVAQVYPPYYDVPSNPFRLMLKSDNKTLDG